MPRATIRDVAASAKVSISTVNRILHEPEKVREATRRAVVEAAEKVGFYGLNVVRDSLLQSDRPKVRIGILLLQRGRVFYRTLGQALEAAAKGFGDRKILVRVEYVDDLSPQNISDCMHRLAETADFLGVV